MIKTIAIFVIIIVLAIAGWMIWGKKNNSPANQPTTITNSVVAPTPPAIANQINVTLNPQNQSFESGGATITQVHGQLLVHLQLKGVTAGISQPASIQIGACPSSGNKVYPLTPVLNGVSDTTINLTVESLKSQLPLTVNVYKSATDLNSAIDCGDIKF